MLNTVSHSLLRHLRRGRSQRDMLRLFAVVGLLSVGLLWGSTLSMAQSAPAGQAPVVSQRPTILGLAKGCENIVAITEDRPPYASVMPGGLRRELARQAFLIAAEEELGLVTLDDSLGEVIPPGDAAAGPFTIRTTGVRRRPVPPQKPFDVTPIDCTITITRPDFRGQTFKWASSPVTLQTDEEYEALVEQIESLSRGVFVEVLKNAGFEKGNPDQAVVPDPKLEHRMDFVSQFAMVRYWHSRLRAGQDHVEALEGLIRAYANLGSLTDFHWSPASKAFRARALIYAQRLIVKHGETPSSLAHRAYALALVGRHGAALQAIEATRKAQGGDVPDWLPLIDAYCSYNVEIVEGVKGVNQELAQYLRMCMVDLRYDLIPSAAIFQKFLKINPACCRAADQMAWMPTIGFQRMATETLFGESWPAIYDRLATVPDLPAAAKKTAESAKGRRSDVRTEAGRRRDLVGQLSPAAEVKKTAGPAWSVLGQMIRDVAFAQAWRALSTEVNIRGVRADASLQRQRSLVPGHRLEKLLDCFSRNLQQVHGTVENFNLEDNAAYVDVAAVPLARQYFLTAGWDAGDKVIQFIDRNTDELYDDAYRRVVLPYEGPSAPSWTDVTPQWPQSIAHDVDRSGTISLADVEAKFPRSVVILEALAERYSKDDLPDDAKRCLLKLIALAPSSSTYLELAKIYEDEEDREQWQQTLLKGLKQPDTGLEHAEIHHQLALWFMRQGKWQQAKSHVAKTVESNAAYSLWTGSRYAEGVENWLESEKYQQQASKQYAPASPDWYFWCVRTGRGKLKDAKALAVNYWGSLSTALDGRQRWGAVAGHVIDGDSPKALPFLEQLGREDLKAAVFAVVLADEQNDVAARNERIHKIVGKINDANPFVELLNLFQGVLSGKETARWNTDAFDMLAVNVTEDNVPYLYMLAGRFLSNHNEKQIANDYLQTAATPFRTDNLAAVIAAETLRKQKLQVGKARLHALPEILAPQVELLKKGRWRQKHGKLDEAEAILTGLLKSHPKFIPGFMARAEVYTALERYADAVTDFEAVIKLSPNFDGGYNGLARLLAACPKDEIRNGAKALEFAERAASLRQYETSDSLATLAWAHAELGQFDIALQLETKARKLAGGDPERNDRLHLYSTNKPYRMKSSRTAAPANVPVPKTTSTSEPKLATIPLPKQPTFQIAKTGEWVSLLEWTAAVDWSPLGINWNDHLEGAPTKQGITLRPGSHSRFPLAVVIDGDYDLEVEFKRASGHEPIAVYFPVGIHTLRLLLDVNASMNVSYVDGKEFGQRATGALVNDKIYRVGIQVRNSGDKSSFNISLDGTRDVIKWAGDTAALRNYDTSEWSTNMIRRPWIGSSNSKVVFQNIRIRSLRGIAQRDPITDADREQDLKNGFVRLIGEPASNISVGAWSFCINQIPLELSGNGAECRWPMITPRFEFCDDYIGAHAPSRVGCVIPSSARSFSTIAYNDSSRTEKYSVLIDGKEAFASRDTGVAVIKIDIPTGAKLLELVADPLGDSAYDHTFWCYPRFHVEPMSRVTDKMLDQALSGASLNISASKAEGAVTRSQPTENLQSGPIHFRNFQPCDEFLFAHAPSAVTFQVPEGMTRFTAIGYNVIGQTAKFEVWADSVRIHESAMAGIVSIDIQLPPNTKSIELKTNDCGNAAGDQCIWCFPRLSRK